MVPKTLALQRAEATSLWITPIVSWVRLACYPLILGLNGIGNTLLRMIGIHRTNTHQSHSPEELEWIIDESEKGGALDEGSADLMRELLTMRETTAGDIMIPRVHVAGLPLNASAQQLRELLMRTSHTRYPVYDKSLDAIVGVIHVKDLIPSLSSGGPLDNQHVRMLPFVPETMAVDDVVNAMRSAEVQMAVVMDEHGGTAGILTEKDLLDELVGEIARGSHRAEIWRDNEGRMHVAGTVLLIDLGDQLECDLEHEDIDTVSGLVLALLERPPQVGDSVEYRGVVFTVEAVAGHGVSECSIEVRLPMGGDAGETDGRQ